MKLVHKLTTGSHAWGIATPDSDLDTMSLVLHEAKEYYGLSAGPKPISQHIFNGQDIVTVDFRHYLQQLAKGNPNMVSILFSRQFDENEVPSPLLDVYVMRRKFITKAWVRAELGMAWRYWCDSNEEGGTLKDVAAAFLRLEILEQVLNYGKICTQFSLIKDVRMGLKPRCVLGGYESFSKRVSEIKKMAEHLPDDGFETAEVIWESVFKELM